eukprot:Awhi_evm1s8394
MPDETMRVVNISSNGDPAFNLSCCDYQREYYSSQSQLCQGKFMLLIIVVFLLHCSLSVNTAATATYNNFRKLH